MVYTLAVDIGIGSVGWAVISAKQDGHPERIEDFGTRIFDSGEDENKRQSEAQRRRGFRGVRRLERRRVHRKQLLRNYFQKIGLMNPTFNDELADCTDADIYALKISGLERKLTPAELFRCLVHTCNHRGYKDFYEPELDDEEAVGNELAANEFESAFRESGCRIVSEYLVQKYANGAFVRFRNRSDSDMPHILIRRALMQEEAEAILNAQRRYYPMLTDDAIEKTVTIIVKQRDFEDGPGDPNDPDRRYHVFLESLGMCPFYKEQKRGFRGTVIADVFAVTNTLSQYRFIDNKTGESRLDSAAACKLVEALLKNAKLTMTDVKKILKSCGYTLIKSDSSDDKALTKSVRFLNIAKSCLGSEYDRYIAQEQFDIDNPSDLHAIGEILSTYQTPSRRREAMKKAGISEEIIKGFSAKKVSGTAAASYEYMCDAIHAFMRGDIYGNFQAAVIRQMQEEAPVERSFKLKPSHIDDPEVRSNPVVFRSINETRKIINAIIEIYGSPTNVVVEVANELGQSMQARGLEQKRQRDREKENDRIKTDIANMLGDEVSKVRGDMVDRYRLFDEQEGKCLYSGKPLGDKKQVVLNRNRAFEVDHIVPFSLILDNTLQNKALVYAGENQRKGQQTPLMYMDAEQAAVFRASVNRMYSQKKISKKKLGYLLQPTIRGEEAEELLSGWKSRNINDTRYITKYVAGMLNKYLIFAGDKRQHVYTVKGAITQKFRKEWLSTLINWGEPEKDRDNYMNHAVDAIIAGNLTRPYIELASDAMRLRSIYFNNQRRKTGEYHDYLDSCVTKMAKYYHFSEDYTRRLLEDPRKIPSFIPRLAEEVAVRLDSKDDEELQQAVTQFYGPHAEFIVPPHMPQFSKKPNRKYQGEIADAKPIRVEEIDGVPTKIKRVSISTVNRMQLKMIHSEDAALIRQLTEILAGKEDKYTIGDYLKETGQKCFRRENGQIVRKVSVREAKTISNYYRKELGEGNYTILGGLNYYCIEVYRNTRGETCTCGIRFVDVVKRNGKLWRKLESVPEDFDKHVLYLMPGDYFVVTKKNGDVKFEGYYQSVYSIMESRYCYQTGNIKPKKPKDGRICHSDKVVKRDISVLGQKGGIVRCSVPLPFIGEKK